MGGEGHQLRFIPTCVGNTAQAIPRNVFAPVHPHVCGEHSSHLFLGNTFTGSSPRVWGTRLRLPCSCLFHRFIPTCVGNTSPVKACGQPISVHPHVCGEHWGLLVYPFCTVGSSPRVWGTRCEQRIDLLQWRFIPTCVGNTG